MQIFASTQNENMLNLATSAGDKNTDRSAGMDFSYLFNLAKISDSTKVNQVKQQSKANRTDTNTQKTQSLYGDNKKDLDFYKKEDRFSKEDKISRKSSTSSSANDKNINKDKKVDPFKNFEESDEATQIKEQEKKAQEDNINVDEDNTDVIVNKENNQALQKQPLTDSKPLTTQETSFDIQSESRPITSEEFESITALNNDCSIFSDEETKDPKADSLTDIFLKSTLKIKEEDEVDEEQTDEETEGETADNIADNAKKLAIKDPSSSEDKTIKSQIASMLSELNAESVEVYDKVDTTQSINDDEFGAKTFEAIEDSIIASIELDKNLEQENNEALLTEENEASEFKKSLDILKAAVKGSATESDGSEDVSEDLVSADENVANSRNTAQNTVFLRDQKNSNSINTSSNSSSKDSGSSLGGNQNHTSASAFIKEMNAKSSTAQSPQTSFSTLLMSSNLKQNAQQITDSVLKMAARNLKTVDIQLSPEGMGKLKISIDMSKSDDVASVSISASNQATKQLVEQGLSDLKERLMANDIKADPKVEEYNEQDQSGQKNNQSGKNSKDQEKEHQLAENGKNNANSDDILSFESLINSQNIDFMSKFA